VRNNCYHTRATTGYLKQCKYSIRLRFRSSSLIPAYRKCVREEAARNCQLRLWIYKGPTGWVQTNVAIWSCRFSEPPVCTSVCQSRRCVPSISFLVRAGARRRCSVPMKLLTAFGGRLHLIGIPGNSRRRECSILRAAVYDLDKLAFAGFRREKRTAGWPLIVTTSQFRLVSTTHIYKFIIRTSGRKLLLHVRREIYVGRIR